MVEISDNEEDGSASSIPTDASNHGTYVSNHLGLQQSGGSGGSQHSREALNAQAQVPAGQDDIDSQAIPRSDAPSEGEQGATTIQLEGQQIQRPVIHFHGSVTINLNIYTRDWEGSSVR